MLVFGTRPEAIKMCPLVNELKRRENVRISVCVTGQHRTMLDSVLRIFDVTPDYDLAVMREGQTLFDITTAVLNGMKVVLEKERPDVVLVHGDTSTAFAAALACFYMRIPTGHVEAGLRTHDIYSPYPEEFNRQAISIAAKYNFAPTQAAKSNLLAEGRAENGIFVTGNTAIDALKTTVRANYSHELLDWAGKSRLIILTAHRRENIGEPMRSVFRAVDRITREYDDVRVIYPVHLNPQVKSAAEELLSGNDSVKLTEPLDVIDFHNLISRSFLILSDSGGVQEEAPALGKPVLVIRSTTERPEGVAAGTLRLIGTEEKTVYNAIKLLLDSTEEYERMSRASNPYGDGFAARRIADILMQEL